MSTKRIRTALAAMRSCIMSGEPWSQRMQADYINATADLEAIEEAAKAWSSRGTVVPPDQMHNFWALLESIARDAS